MSAKSFDDCFKEASNLTDDITAISKIACKFYASEVDHFKDIEQIQKDSEWKLKIKDIQKDSELKMKDFENTFKCKDAYMQQKLSALSQR